MTLPEWCKMIDDPSNHIGKKVHVTAWNLGCVFILDDYDKETGEAHLRTRVSNKKYKTKLLPQSSQKLQRKRAPVSKP